MNQTLKQQSFYSQNSQKGSGGKRRVTTETSKTLGGIGALLMFIGAIPIVGAYMWIIAFVGLVLVLVALKGFADNYNQAGIFNNALYGVIAAIVGGVIAIYLMATAALDLLSKLGISIEDMSSWTTMPQLQNLTMEELSPFLLTVLASVVVLFVFFVVMALLVRKSLKLMAEKTGVKLFGTTGLILLVGAILTIVAVGLLLVWIALLLLAIAFFSIKPAPPPEPPK
jgi:uncharacterized membrane protein